MGLHDGALGGAAAVLDDGHPRLGDGRLVGRRLWDLSLRLWRSLTGGGEKKKKKTRSHPGSKNIICHLRVQNAVTHCARI